MCPEEKFKVAEKVLGIISMYITYGFRENFLTPLTARLAQA